MNIKNTIIKHYKKFFDLNAKGIALDEDDHLNLDWAEDLVKNCFIPNVMHWVAVDDELPPILETIWLSNGKGWTDLGCRVETNEGWHWAGQNGIIYQEKDQIVAECDSDDLDVVYWCKLPKPPCA